MSRSGAPKIRSLREEQADVVRERLVQAAFALIEAGEEPTMRAVAQKGGVSERTIYRYFESRDALYEAVLPLFMGRVGLPLCGRLDDLPDYVRDLFTLFEENRALLSALTSAAWAAPYLPRTRGANLRALRALFDEAFPGAPKEDRAAAASGVRVALSGAGYAYLRDAGLSRDEAIAHVQWLVRTAGQALRGKRR